MSDRAGLTRRGLLVAGLTAAGALWLGPAARGRGATDGEAAALNPFVTIGTDGRVLITAPRSEMGQGILTALAMIVAEELDVAWSAVEARQAPGDAARFGHQETGGSASVRTRFTDLRRAGAAARAMLRAAAAEHLGVPAAGLETRDGEVRDPATGRTVAYGALLAAAARIAPPQDPPLKAVADFRIIGRAHKPVELDAVLAGRPGFGIDVRRPAMRHAAILRCPWFGGTLDGFDDRAARAVPGVRDVFAIGPVAGNAGVAAGIAVVADDTHAAFAGTRALEARWRPPPGERDDDALLEARLDALLAAPPEDLVFSQGEPARMLDASDAVITARYDLPFLAHATLEPMNCTAHFTGNVIELWAPTQTPGFSAALVAGALGLAPEQVRMNVARSGGGFGRRLNPDFAVEAALVARRSGGPVQVTWPRDEDLQHDFYRSRAAHALSATLGPDGQPIAWRHRLASVPIFAQVDFPPYNARPALYEAIGAVDMAYRVPHRDCGFSRLPSRVPVGWWRAVSTTHTAFAVESFIDELAHAAGADPLAYRLALIDALPAAVPNQDPAFPFDPERLRGVLRLAAGAADWSRPAAPGRGRGVACTVDHLTCAAHVVELSVTPAGELRVHRVVAAIDCGLAINPEGIRAQVEGSVMQGLSAALREAVRIEDGRVVQQNFDEYPLLRQAEAPERIDVLIRQSTAPPTGAGEPALPGLAPALANAIFAATGRRIRRLPITTERLRAALADAAGAPRPARGTAGTAAG